MPKSRPPYPAEFRQQMVELVSAGRTPAEWNPWLERLQRSEVPYIAVNLKPVLGSSRWRITRRLTRSCSPGSGADVSP